MKTMHACLEVDPAMQSPSHPFLQAIVQALNKGSTWPALYALTCEVALASALFFLDWMQTANMVLASLTAMSNQEAVRPIKQRVDSLVEAEKAKTAAAAEKAAPSTGELEAVAEEEEAPSTGQPEQAVAAEEAGLSIGQPSLAAEDSAPSTGEAEAEALAAEAEQKAAAEEGEVNDNLVTFMDD